MTIEINSPKLTPAVATYGAFAVRKSDGFRWNNAAQAWQASPSNADSFIALTDRGGVNAGLYRGSNSGDMGDAGLVEITMHDSASSYALVAGTGAGTITVMGGDEVQTALVGSAMTLAPDAVNAAALAADAVGKIRTEIDTNSTKLDVAISTRLASVGYTAPDNTSIAAILADTGTDGVVVAAASKSGYALSAAGLDAIPVTAPSGVATTFREMVVQTWRRFFKKTTLTSSQLKTLADDGSTVVTTQTVSDDGTIQTQGTAS